jgi:hypothetical protein
MSLLDAASLSDGLLVIKGDASPAGAEPRRTRRIRSPDDRPRVALRLDEDRRKRLKLASVHLHKSTQAMLLAALDHYFERVVPTLVGESCTCLAAPGAGAGTCVTLPLRPR